MYLLSLIPSAKRSWRLAATGSSPARIVDAPARRAWRGRAAGAARGPRTFAELWDTLLPRLEQAVVLHDGQGGGAALAWPGRRDPRTGPLDGLLEEAGRLLAGDGGQGRRAEVAAVEAEIRRVHERISRYHRQRVSAPARARWRWTVDRYDAAIAAEQLRLRGQETRLADLKAAFAGELRDLGLAVDPTMVDLLLSTVVGDDLVGIARAVHNVRRVTEQLEGLVRASGEDLQSARRYYGMYSVLLQALDRLHGGLIDALDRRYLRGLEGVVGRTLALLHETRTLLRQVPEHAPVLLANIDAQNLTLRAASAYRSYLLAQRRQLATARASLAGDVAVAANTYETVKVSGELVGLLATGSGLLRTLEHISVPPLRAFESAAMRRELERLTLRLRAERLPAPQ